jgi:GT2 family glycosyltransferase
MQATAGNHDEIDVSVIIVSYNTRDLTNACIDSVKEATQSARFEVIVLDNASSDGSAEAIAERHPDVTLIVSDENLGFARGVNRAAQDAKGRYLVLLNPDARLLGPAIDQLVELANRMPEYGVFGGRTLDPSGQDNQSSCWNEPSVWSMFCRASGLAAVFEDVPALNPERVFFDPGEEAVPVDIVAGCLLLIRRELWESLGGFDPSYFMYGEDFDLCVRARKLGQPAVMFPGIQIEHIGGASEKVQSDRVIRVFRAKVQYFHRHWDPPRAWAGSRMLMMWAASRRVGYRVAGLLGRSTDPGVARSWDEIWRRRQEFLDAGKPTP